VIATCVSRINFTHITIFVHSPRFSLEVNGPENIVMFIEVKTHMTHDDIVPVNDGVIGTDLFDSSFALPKESFDFTVSLGDALHQQGWN
jgi:hypothetical protein